VIFDNDERTKGRFSCLKHQYLEKIMHTSITTTAFVLPCLP